MPPPWPSTEARCTRITNFLPLTTYLVDFPTGLYARDGAVTDAARDDVLEVREVGRDVEGEAVHRHLVRVGNRVRARARAGARARVKIRARAG